MFALAHLLIGFGVASLFGPLIADCSHWFLRRRGIAVAVAASGNYLAGTVWPIVTQKAMLTYGWRPTHIAHGDHLPVHHRSIVARFQAPLVGA